MSEEGLPPLRSTEPRMSWASHPMALGRGSHRASRRCMKLLPVPTSGMHPIPEDPNTLGWVRRFHGQKQGGWGSSRT